MAIYSEDCHPSDLPDTNPETDYSFEFLRIDKGQEGEGLNLNKLDEEWKKNINQIAESAREVLENGNLDSL